MKEGQTIGQWLKWDFETNGNLEIKDTNGNLIYFEGLDEFWTKREYDSQGNQIYFENSKGFWAKREYDSQGNKMYYENSDGDVEDNRPKPCEGKVVEIDGVKYKLVKV
jgi:hypothetical protein